MINSVRTTTLALLNKHNFGYVGPMDWNLLAKQAQLEVFENLFYRYSQMYLKQTARASGSGYADNVRNILQDIEDFSEVRTLLSTAVNNGKYPLPQECYYLNTVRYNGNYSDKATNSKIMDLLSSHHTTPTKEFSSYVRNGNVISVYPAPESGDALQIEFVRYPLDPNWTYRVLSNGEPVFDQSSSSYQDFELPQSYEPELVMKICSYLGLTIREQEVMQFTKGEELESDAKKG